MPDKILFFDNCHMIKIGFQQILKNYSAAQFITVLWNNIDDRMNEAIDYHKPDILIINFDTIQKGVIDKVIDYIKNNHKKLKTILLSNFMPEFILDVFFFKGVLGFLHINSKGIDIVNCIKRVQNKQVYISSELEKKKDQNVNGFIKRSLSILTKKEVEVTELIIKGKTSKEIALILNNSPRTIETHRKNIAEKFDILGQGKLTFFLVGNRKIISELLKTSKENIENE
ncbi:hypothetical protein A8C32_17235 [Flavivirga aquatica]|uniref:HTH luxR-type domain-containing protein n=1 Tax=Flavivirga aquatica TaxID=1849968 RepID=A0A1E5T847_9FLAO|nr:LuxR C-terminal-related transcriptional regulator [Flavivirga aquatica]OEK07540.1 hypothetical protein A8C32_17235 [Flavivirga aquatica]